MIKVLKVVARQQSLAPEEFQRYWRDVHGPLVARVPGLRQYIQCHTVYEAQRNATLPVYDGVGELVWDSMEDWDRAQETPEWAAVVEDAKQCIGEVLTAATVERPIIDAFPDPRERAGMIKRMGFLKRRDDMSVEQFQHHWHDVHAPLVLEELTDMRRYVQAHVLVGTRGPEGRSAFDGVPQSWWDGLEVGQLQQVAMADRPRTTAVADLDNFAGPREVANLATREVVILDTLTA